MLAQCLNAFFGKFEVNFIKNQMILSKTMKLMMNKTQGFRVELQVSGGRGNRLRTRQGQGKDKTGTWQGQDRDKIRKGDGKGG